jgi:outer membrane protein assembly factor BamB
MLELQQQHRRGPEAGLAACSRCGSPTASACLVSAAGGLRHRPRCSPAQSAAVSAIPGVAFSGSVDGHMRAYSTADGTILWDVNTIDVYEGVNGVLGRGGSIDGPGPTVANGIVYVNSATLPPEARRATC